MKNKYIKHLAAGTMALYLALAADGSAAWRKGSEAEPAGKQPAYAGAGMEKHGGDYMGEASGPEAWERMRAEEWDAVPEQPRRLAFADMIRHAVRTYGTGGAYGLPEEAVGSALAAIAARESAFNHRAVNKRTGDHGLMQLSPYARKKIGEWDKEGVVDIGIGSDSDWFDPYKSALAGTYWFGVLLGEAGGDMDKAIRAYNVGISRANAGRGYGYQRAVMKLMKRNSQQDVIRR